MVSMTVLSNSKKYFLTRISVNLNQKQEIIDVQKVECIEKDNKLRKNGNKLLKSSLNTTLALIKENEKTESTFKTKVETDQEKADYIER